MQAQRNRLQGAFGARSKGNRSGRLVELEVEGMAPVVALNRVCASLRTGEIPSDEVLVSRFGRLPGEESLLVLGAELGADFSVSVLKPRALRRCRGPFVCLLPDGSAIGVLGRNRAGKRVCLARGGRILLEDRQLAGIATGTIIRVAPLDSEEERDAQTGAHGSEHVFGGVLGRFARMEFAGQTGRLLQLWVAAGLSNMVLLTLPLFITTVYDRVIPHGAFETLAALTIGIVIIFAVDIGLRANRVNLQEAIGVSASHRLQTRFYRKLLHTPLAASEKSSSGISALLGEVDHVAMALPALFAGYLSDLPFVLIMLTLVGFLTGPVVLAPVTGILLIGVVNLFGSLRARRAAGEAHGLKLKLQDETIASAMMLPTVKAMGAEGELLRRWENRLDETAFKMHRARQSVAVAGQTGMVLTQLIIAFAIVIGAVQINAGAMTLGNLAAAVLLVGRILSPVSQVIALSGQLGNMRAALVTYFRVVDQPDEKAGDSSGRPDGAIKGAFRLHKASFGYDGSPSLSLEQVSFEIKPGEKVGIIGRNGCGKSTLLALLPRFYELSSGTFRIDGFDSRQISPQLLRRSLGVMFQDTVLMQGSLRANICLGVSDVCEVDFRRAVEVSGVLEIARRHPQGFSLDVGPRGEALSGGERQMVGLARALLRNPGVLILDEPTSAMDNTAESRVISALANYVRGRTLIVATHRTQILSLVDRVILMDRGRILADGPRDQVLSGLRKAS